MTEDVTYQVIGYSEIDSYYVSGTYLCTIMVGEADIWPPGIATELGELDANAYLVATTNSTSQGTTHPWYTVDESECVTRHQAHFVARVDAEGEWFDGTLLTDTAWAFWYNPD